MAETRPSFRTPAGAAAFEAAYDALLNRWPVPVGAADVLTSFGRTRVHSCGPHDGPPLVLLHGHGATSAVWFATVGQWARTRRVHAVDLIGDAGHSVADGRPVRAVAHLTGWLDEVLDGLDVPGAALCGHSYGAWIALSYALHAPDRVHRLVLLDPTDCFAGLSPTYKLRAVPLLVAPSARAWHRFLAWETGGMALDAGWRELSGLAAGEVRTSPVVLPRRPATDRLRACTVPTLVLVAERSRCHDADRVADAARRALPDVRTAVLPGATHHTIPTQDADRLSRVVGAFLGGRLPDRR